MLIVTNQVNSCSCSILNFYKKKNRIFPSRVYYYVQWESNKTIHLICRINSRCSEMSPAFQVDDYSDQISASDEVLITPIPASYIQDVNSNKISEENMNFQDDSEEDMDVAEDIVFRPLFRYRQETRLRQQYSPDRRPSFRKSNNRYRYKAENPDYD